MNLQDLPVPRNKDLKAHVLFNNGAQTTLIRDSFGFQAGWPYEAASYTLAGVGGLPVNCPNGRLWNVALLDNQGKTYQFKGFSVPKIIEEPLESGPKLHL